MSHEANRRLLDAYHSALYDYSPAGLKAAIHKDFAADAVVHLCHPLGDLERPADLLAVYADLAAAIPDLERRETIRIAGDTFEDGDWIGACGYYTGVMTAPWLDIPPTGHQVAMRFHEFYKVTDNQIVEMQAIWDIPELMMQCNAWPMAPQLGRFWQVPGPATQDGVQQGERNLARSQSALNLVESMLSNLLRFATEGVEGMRLSESWHPKMNWYGPAGIGTNRGIQGFRHWHQKPFLKAFPNRMGTGGKGILFADNDYVGVTGWPNMKMILSGDGFLGLVPGNQEITMRSLDFWRCENGLIRENWVTVDILHVFDQLGVDVFERMREMTPTPIDRGRLPG